jgi:hypothetical protein
MGSRFLLAIDGTGLYSFRSRHCEHCIETRHESGVATYSHNILVAFIVSADGYALPVACEFIENPGTVYVKQDCENEGFNVLKNGGFALEHVYSHNPVAAKGYVLLMLIAHIVQQLLTRGRMGAVFKNAFHTFLNYGKQMLAARSNQALPPDLDLPGQIRLSTA